MADRRRLQCPLTEWCRDLPSRTESDEIRLAARRRGWETEFESTPPRVPRMGAHSSSQAAILDNSTVLGSRACHGPTNPKVATNDSKYFSSEAVARSRAIHPSIVPTRVIAAGRSVVCRPKGLKRRIDPMMAFFDVVNAVVVTPTGDASFG